MIDKKKLSKIRFRCSELGSIMVGTKSQELTENQIETVKKLEAKLKNSTITSKQKDTLDRLLKKRDSQPELSAGVKTYLKKKFKELYFGKKSNIVNKYLDKGIYVEDASISLLSSVDNKFYIKNRDWFDNTYIHGTPDNVQDKVRDIKSSWNHETFPLFAKEIADTTYHYYWQLMGYMALTGLKEAELIYCLVDTPEHLIENEVNYRCKKAGIDVYALNRGEIVDEKEEERAVEAYEKIRSETFESMLFSNIPAEKRIKRFHIEYNPKEVNKLYSQIDLCRKYLVELYNETI